MRYLLLCCLLLTGCITVDPHAEKAAEKALDFLKKKLK